MFKLSIVLILCISLCHINYKRGFQPKSIFKGENNMSGKLSNLWIKFLIIAVILYLLIFVSGKACGRAHKTIGNYISSAVIDELVTDEELNKYFDDQTIESEPVVNNKLAAEYLGIWKNVDQENSYIEIDEENITTYLLLNGEPAINNIIYYQADNDNNKLLLDYVTEYNYKLDENGLTIVFTGSQTETDMLSEGSDNRTHKYIREKQ